MSDKTTEVLMPLMGEGVNEATLVKWLKSVGDKVGKDEPILEVSTDKVDTEIPAPADGFLVHIAAEEGETVEVDQVLGALGESAEAKYTPSEAKATKKKAVPAKAAAKPQATPSASGPSFPVSTTSPVIPGNIKSSPLVQKIARENGVDLAIVPGTGLHGRITKRDIVAFLSGERRPLAQTAAPAKPEAFHNLETEMVDGQECLDGVPVRREKMSKMRKLIAEHMVESVQVSPHVTTVFEIDLDKVVTLREKIKADFKAKEGFNLTYTHIFVYAASLAIKKHPYMNCSLDGDEILYKDDINMGCAVAIDGGLIVPVLKKTQDMNLLSVAKGLNDIVTRARSKKLMPDDVKGGTFSITNPGGFGSLTSNPIINQPQVAILGIGNIVKRPMVVDDEIKIRPMILMSITFDHRVVDGEGGALYLATLKQILENFDENPL